MRSSEQIENIKKNISEPFVIKDFLNTEDILHLINLFSKTEVNPVKVYKNTGPITVDIRQFANDLVIEKIFEKLFDHIGNYELTAGFFFTTNYPHIIHNDDLHDLPNNVYKGITIPLKINGNAIPKLCFFNQFYFHGPSKFFNGDNDIPTFYNKQVYNYELVENLTKDHKIDNLTISKYFTHLKPSWLDGLSLWGCLDWIPGDAIIFDSVRLHCASDFRAQGIKDKLGISIFTKKI